MSLVANEQAKLSAAYVNTLAVAVFVVGMFTPLVTAGYTEATATSRQYAGSLVCIVGSLVLHLGARRLLRRLVP